MQYMTIRCERVAQGTTHASGGTDCWSAAVICNGRMMAQCVRAPCVRPLPLSQSHHKSIRMQDMFVACMNGEI